MPQKNIMAELEKYLDRARAAKDNDERLAAIMTDMENRYDIPALASWLPSWEKKTPHAQRIFEVYKYVSGLRNL